MIRIKWIGALLLLMAVPVLLAQSTGVRKRAPRPEHYGRVVLDLYASENGMQPVVFDHWVHRSRFTCRLCHVDLGFGMTAGETGVRDEDNQAGFYCGACHNGTTAFARATEEIENCDRCHLSEGESARKRAFRTFSAKMPRARFGDRIDWLRAEQDGLVELVDYLEGISIQRKELRSPGDTGIDAKVDDMPDILFSHDLHTVWNGCELCHPQIFPVNREHAAYQMQDIFEGRFCGACHGSVAFTTQDCRLCHTTDPEAA